MKTNRMWLKRSAMLSAMAACALMAQGGVPVEEQVKNCFARQYEEQLRQFSIPYQIMVSNVKPDGDDGFYLADVFIQIEPTSTVYKVIVEPKGETTWTAPHIDDDIDESLLPISKREEMNAKIQRFLLTDFKVVAPAEKTELNGYLKSAARFKVDFSGTDDATVVGSGNEGKISFSGVRFFELHSTTDVLAQRVFIAGTKEYEMGKKRHLKKRWEMGTVCASINENARFVKTLRVMETNSVSVTDEELNIFTRNVDTPEIRRLRERSRAIRDTREKEAQKIRRKYVDLKKEYERKGITPKALDAKETEFEREIKSMVEKKRNEILDTEKQISKARKDIHDAIRREPSRYEKETRIHFDASVNDFNAIVK